MAVSDVKREQLLTTFALFDGKAGGLGNLVHEGSSQEVFERLDSIDREPLSRTQLNQLLHLSHEAGLSEGFFTYYWSSTPTHTYDVCRVPGYHENWRISHTIQGLEHLKWGIYRVALDSLFYFGNLRSGYRELRTKTKNQLEEFFQKRRIDTEAIKSRGPFLPLSHIARDDRYLISEMACKSYGDPTLGSGDLKALLFNTLRSHLGAGGGRITVRKLLEQGCQEVTAATRQQEFLFSADDILDEEVESGEQLESRYERISTKFQSSREAALQNTRYYLSMVNDLDIYVATSMRDREDFRKMADFCDQVFKATALDQLKLRYFDPTLSAAEGHEDKGLIECLMVKCAKVLVYSAGKKESYGKDAEAAMALSLGKPVIFYCDEEQKSRFYREVHPLSRLIDFETGVSVGAIITSSVGQVIELIGRIFENRMEYEFEQPKPGYYRVKEKLTGSVVRLQTNNELLTETFWNYYHNRV